MKVIRFLASVPEGRDVPDRGPTRVALASALTLPGLPPPVFAAVEVLWFADGHDRVSQDGSCAVVVEEVVLRGADYLAARWRGGGERFKMMSFGRRDPALSRAEFTARWRTEAGRLGGEVIPDDVRGRAYVQDHPVGDDVAFDAVNEVWFDRLDDLRRRAAWFASRPVPAGLMSPDECWSLYLREVPLR